jgi:hypothetical protein
VLQNYTFQSKRPNKSTKKYENNILKDREIAKMENWMYVQPLVDADLNKLSKNEQEALDDSIAKYAGLSYDEIKEKSHDIAWRSTARDFSIKWEDIAREAGLDSEEMECINEFSALQAALS